MSRQRHFLVIGASLVISNFTFAYSEDFKRDVSVRLAQKMTYFHYFYDPMVSNHDSF